MSQGLVRDYLVKATGATDVFVNGVKQATTSGTLIDFTGIPSGVKQFTVSCVGVSSNGTSVPIIQLGDSGGFETSGYVGKAVAHSAGFEAYDTYSTGFSLKGNNAAAHVYSFNYIFTLQDAASNTWVMSGPYMRSDGSAGGYTGGYKSLSGELTQVRLTHVNGTDTFDAGSVNIQYENPDLAISGNGSVAAGVTDVFVNGVKQASTSGTSIDFTIPSGVKAVKISYVGCSTTGASEPIVQIGDSGGLKVTGYLGAGSNVNTAGVSTTNKTAGFAIGDAWTAGRTWHGTTILTLHDSATNTWVSSSLIGRSDSTGQAFGNGSASLSNELTTVRITTEGGTETFDAGSINIQYENQDLDLGSGVISGGVVQTVHTQDGEVATGTGTIPNDDTIPQNTEGNEFMTASITPKNAANKLKIEVVMQASHSAASNSYIGAALFQDSTADALAAGKGGRNLAAGTATSVVFTHWMTAGTTSSTTFKVRGGVPSAGTITFNGSSGGRRFGGVMASSITITEYQA